MAARQCPNCLVLVRVTTISAHSSSLVCPGCGKHLEISRLSRNLSEFIGLAVGALVWRATTAYYAGHSNPLDWLLPIVFAYLALSLAQPLVLMLTADLRLKDLAEVPAAPDAHASSGHGGHGSHGGAHGAPASH